MGVALPLLIIILCLSCVTFVAAQTRYFTGPGTYDATSCPTSPCGLCPAGSYNSGCGGLNNGTCLPCTSSQLPLNAQWVASTNCSWACASAYEADPVTGACVMGASSQYAVALTLAVPLTVIEASSYMTTLLTVVGNLAGCGTCNFDTPPFQCTSCLITVTTTVIQAARRRILAPTTLIDIQIIQLGGETQAQSTVTQLSDPQVLTTQLTIANYPQAESVQVTEPPTQIAVVYTPPIVSSSTASTKTSASSTSAASSTAKTTARSTTTVAQIVAETSTADPATGSTSSVATTAFATTTQAATPPPPAPGTTAAPASSSSIVGVAVAGVAGAVVIVGIVVAVVVRIQSRKSVVTTTVPSTAPPKPLPPTPQVQPPSRPAPAVLTTPPASKPPPPPPPSTPKPPIPRPPSQQMGGRRCSVLSTQQLGYAAQTVIRINLPTPQYFPTSSQEHSLAAQYRPRSQTY